MKSKFFIVDKEYGASHSFVEGMVKKYLMPLNNQNRIYFSKRVEKENEKKIMGQDFFDVESNFKRNGIQKLFFSISSFTYFLRKYPTEYNEVFIRNELIALVIFSFYKKICPGKYTLSFQSSFPHEEASSNYFKRMIAKSMMLLSLQYTDRIYVVSDLAEKRLKKYIPKKDIPIYVVPLCSDFPIRKTPIILDSNVIKFVYIGTFSNLRCLDLVIKSFHQLKANRITNWRFELYGGDKSEFLIQYPEVDLMVNELVDHGLIKFNRSLKRDLIIQELDQHHVGVNLIPPTTMYLESSSTKLGEYLSRALPVLSNSEIPYHQTLYNEGDIGWLCNFNHQSVYTSLQKIINSSPECLESKSENSLRIAKNTLNYKDYLSKFI